MSPKIFSRKDRISVFNFLTIYGDDFSEKFDLQEIVDDGNLNHQHQSNVMQQQNKNISLRYLKLFDARPMAMIIRVK